MKFHTLGDAVVPLCSRLSVRRTALSHALKAILSALCGAADARGLAGGSCGLEPWTTSRLYRVVKSEEVYKVVAKLLFSTDEGVELYAQLEEIFN